MDRINDVKDETIKTLAQTLKTSGLAASETEAIRMATNMAQTNKKVNDTFEERKEKNIMGLSFLHKEYKKNNPKEKIVEEEIYAEEPAQHEEKNEEDCCGACDCHHQAEEQYEEENLNDLFEAETKDEFITQDLIRKQPEEQEEQPEKTQEIPVNKEAPKRDLSQYKESKVNLGDVFKFKG